MKQVLIIHGGNSYSSHNAYINDLKSMQMDYERLKYRQKWNAWIAEQLPDADVLLPIFPNASNAVYDEWVLYFEKIMPFFGDDVSLVGHSLGAMFLAKYLHEKPLKNPVQQVVLIAGAYDDAAEDCGSFCVGDATGLEKSAATIHLFHSQDDPVVPFSELAKFQADMLDAVSHVFTDRKHFNTPEFPELLEILQQK